MRRFVRATAVAGAAALLCLAANPSQAIPWPQGVPSQLDPNNTSGQVMVAILNQLPTAVQLTFEAQNSSHCAGNSFENSAGTWTEGTSPPLDPGATGTAYMVTSACFFDGVIAPPNTDGAFTLGLLGYSQFEFAVTWSGVGEFEDFHWEQGYTGGGNTGGMYMYDCGTFSLLGSGNALLAPRGTRAGSNFDYDNGTTVCFVVQPGSYDPTAIPGG